MPNIVQMTVSGPADLFVGTGSGGALECLGFSEDDVEVSLDFPKRPVRTSMTGDTMYDSQYMGVEASLSVRLNLYDEQVLLKLLAVINLGTAGTIGANTIGTLLRQEGHAPRMLLRSRYGAGQSGAAQHPNMDRMIPVLNFPHSQISREMRVNVGTRVRMWQARFDAITTWNPTDGSGVVWNTDNSGIPAYSFLGA